MALAGSLVLICLVSGISAITTTHHDKPDTIITISSIPSTTPRHVESSTAPVLVNFNVTMPTAERKKRLLPYQNFYFDQPFNRPHKAGVSAQQYQDYQEVRKPNKKPQKISTYQHQKYTPFLDSNALPGPFRPIMNPQHHQPQPYYQEERPVEVDDLPPPSSDLSAIYDKLAQLKLRQQAMQQKAPYGYRLVPQYRFREKPQKVQEYRPFRYNNVQPTKTTIETFTATNIDIPGKIEEDQQEPIRYHQIPTPVVEQHQPPTKYRENVKPYVHHQVTIEVPQSSVPLTLPSNVGRKPTLKQRPKAYILIQPGRPAKQEQVVVVRKPKPVTIVDENYVAEKYVPVVFTEPQRPQQETPASKFEIQYQATPAPVQHYQENFQVVNPPRPQEEYYRYQTITSTPSPVTHKVVEQYDDLSYAVTQVTPKAEDVVQDSSLGALLKHLQETNALPPTLTADSIDNSIKTLMKILDALKDRQKQQKPMVVQEEYEYDNEAGVDLGGDALDTPGGGTPGKPGVDYPALSSIPKTSFSCKTQRYKGFFGDPDTHCQVWHYCDLNGGQASFLCPNGTIFSQVALTCDWWFNVKCASTPQLYVLNERLYKYIIPLSPKFPEDYSGPLVDKYLAMKFQEMEEKLRKQKKGKGNADSEDSTENDDSTDEEEQEVEETDRVSTDDNTETTTITDVSKL